MQLRNNILVVTIAIMLASLIFSVIAFKTSLGIVEDNRSSIRSQQLNEQEMSVALENCFISIKIKTLYCRS